MKFVILATVVICAIVAEAACPAGQSGNSVTVCTAKPKWVNGGGGVLKNFGNAMCTAQANSDNECVAFTEGLWKSGFSTGKSTCKVYHRKDCRGPFVDVNMDGRFKFDRSVMSFRCNCRVNAVLEPSAW